MLIIRHFVFHSTFLRWKIWYFWMLKLCHLLGEFIFQSVIRQSLFLPITLWVLAAGILNDLCSSECIGLFISPWLCPERHFITSALERHVITIFQVKYFLFLKPFFDPTCLPQAKLILFFPFDACIVSEYLLNFIDSMRLFRK